MASGNMQAFSARDRDQDGASWTDCARDFHEGAWWHYGCSHININSAVYGRGEGPKAMFWINFNNDYVAVKTTKMMIITHYR